MYDIIIFEDPLRHLYLGLFKVSELEIPRSQAEKALFDNNGDLAKTLRALITP